MQCHQSKHPKVYDAREQRQQIGDAGDEQRTERDAAVGSKRLCRVIISDANNQGEEDNGDRDQHSGHNYRSAPGKD
jgi:hypothetical protein